LELINVMSPFHLARHLPCLPWRLWTVYNVLA